MAKKSNTTELAAGLSFGDSRKVDNPSPETLKEPAVTVQPQEKQVIREKEATAEPVAETAAQQSAPAPTNSKSLAEIYEEQMRPPTEPRTVRLQTVISKRSADKLDTLMAEGKIRSKNDLINFLLEGYLGSVE